MSFCLYILHHIFFLPLIIQNLATLAHQKLKEREENALKYAPDNAVAAALANSGAAVSHNHLMHLPVEVAGQRTSLPDITLTPKYV